MAVGFGSPWVAGWRKRNELVRREEEVMKMEGGVKMGLGEGEGDGGGDGKIVY